MASPVKVSRLWASIAVGALVASVLAVMDWFALWNAWQAEDAGPLFAVAMVTIVLDLARTLLLGGFAYWVFRNPGFIVGILMTVLTPRAWSKAIVTLPGTTVADPSQGTMLIPGWSLVLILTWDVAMLAFWVALLWPGLRWRPRLRNAAPFLAVLVALLMAFRLFCGA